ncbi:MAG: hypothetical protein AB7O43_21755 [Hyphomicrobiaceae bacterium]
MGQPLHKFLEEFAGDEDAEAGDVSVHPLRPRLAAAPPPLPTSSDNGRLGEAYARGFEEGRAAAQEQADSELMAARADFDHRLEEARSVFSQAIAERLSVDLHRQLEQMQAALSDQVASALMPVLRLAFTEAAIRELADGIRTLAGDGEAVAIELSGPQEMVDRVWGRYRELEGERASSSNPDVRFNYSDAADVRVRINDSIIESRLAEWIARLAEVAD